METPRHHHSWTRKPFGAYRKLKDYIRYADGSEEYYDHTKDPYEWKNLAATSDLSRFKKWLPKKEVASQVLKKNSKKPKK